MNNKQLEIICCHFNLGKSISTPKKVPGGLLHLMWHIETEKGSFAAKQLSKNIILTEKVRKFYELSEKVASQFSFQGIPLISALDKNGKFLVDADNSTFIIYPWTNAKVLDKNKINNAHVIKISKLLAKIHLINLQVTKIESPQYDLHDNEEIIYLIEKSAEMSLPFSNTLQQYKPMIIKLNDEYQQAINLFKHNFVVSHADLDPKNVLWDETNNPILIDWESVRAVNPAYEILIAALDWSGATIGELNIELFLSMINEYKKSGGKIDEKILNENFYGIPGNGISWLVYNIKRSIKTDISPEEKEIGINQVNQAINSMKYIESKIEYLKKMMKNYK